MQHQVDVEISKLPTVEGENTAMEMSKSILGILQKSEILMKSFSDQYIATDTALVACLENENVNKIFSDSGYDFEKIIEIGVDNFLRSLK